MDLLWHGPEDPAATLVLAHGAGAAMDSAWMDRICALLADRGIRTARFEFSYMAARREGRRPPAPKAELSMGEYEDAVAAVVAHAGSPVLIGGKSYGGRVASLVADDLDDVDGLVCLAYPFHPPSKPDALRTAHLRELRTPTLICQGTRDPFGTADEVPGFGLSPAITVAWFDGAHDIQPLGRLAAVADAVAGFARTVPRT
ncbi:MAG TPA: alpha/beta family hydrolase [Pseudolysinimonas sp.]|nr:alpha/beta family hydrolase [Pseudolysinimonas sp.]